MGFHSSLKTEDLQLSLQLIRFTVALKAVGLQNGANMLLKRNLLAVPRAGGQTANHSCLKQVGPGAHNWEKLRQDYRREGAAMSAAGGSSL